MRRATVLLALVALTALANVRVYDVAPYKCYEGWTAGGQGSYVAQSFIACADSLVYAEWFAGQKPTHSEQGYLIQVLDGITELCKGYATDTLEWAYVRANLSRSPGAPALVRGKTYTLKVSHTGNPPQKVNYFFDPRESTYAYGALARDQQVELQNDLVCRIYGVMNPVDSTYWGASSPALTVSV